MTRRLSAHERALWQRVAASVRPLPGNAPVSAPAMVLPAAPKPVPAAAPAKPFKAPPKPVLAATLDAGWDRKLTRGRFTPDRVIDLHDHSLERANQVLNRAVEDAAAVGDRVLLVITGKGSASRPGRIRAEVHHWLDSAHIRHRIAALRPASPRHGGSGAFYLVLRRLF